MPHVSKKFLFSGDRLFAQQMTLSRKPIMRYNSAWAWIPGASASATVNSPGSPRCSSPITAGETGKPYSVSEYPRPVRASRYRKFFDVMRSDPLHSLHYVAYIKEDNKRVKSFWTAE